MAVCACTVASVGCALVLVANLIDAVSESALIASCIPPAAVNVPTTDTIEAAASASNDSTPPASTCAAVPAASKPCTSYSICTKPDAGIVAE